MANYPASLDALTNPAPTDPTTSVTVPHATQHATVNDILEALEAKLGIGTTTPGVANRILGSDSPGVTSWRQLVNADVDAAAAIAYSKLSLANGIVNGDVNAAAAIVYSKLNLTGSVVNGDVHAAAAIDLAKLAHLGTGNVLKSNGSINVAGQIVNADVYAAAAIALAKIAHVGAGNVVRSDGSTNVAGQVQVGDIAARAPGTILGSTTSVAQSLVTSGVWSNLGVSVTTTGLVVGRSQVAIFVFGTSLNVTVAANMSLGIGIDNPGAPTYTNTVTAPATNVAVFQLAGGVHTATATSHTYGGLWLSAGGQMDRFGSHTLIALVIN